MNSYFLCVDKSHIAIVLKKKKRRKTMCLLVGKYRMKDVDLQVCFDLLDIFMGLELFNFFFFFGVLGSGCKLVSWIVYICF